ncbi:MAG: MFS transporter [Chloroflexi bacterium]|nr:MAG: MFS transporter [Chloroflexota bacterium]
MARGLQHPNEPTLAKARVAPEPRFRPAMFAALRHRNFRLYWIGALVANTGDWMDQIAIGWLIWELTGSGSYLGLLAFCRAFPILLFTLFGGAVADRFERRRVMQTTQSLAMLLALLLALLVFTDIVRVWHVLAIAALRGVLLSINLPTRQAMLSDIVDRQHLSNAIALNSATLNLTRILGGSAGGLLISLIGTAGVFLVNGLSFVILIAALALMHIPPVTRSRQRIGMLRSIGEGLTYLRGNTVLRSLVVLALVPMIFGMPYMSLLPIFADHVLGIGNEGYGLLVAATGCGAVAGSLLIAAKSDVRRRGQLMLLVMMGFGAMLFLFSRSQAPWLSVVLLFGVGAGQTGYMALNTTLLQTHSSDEMRGRVMSIFFLNRGLVPLGTLTAGFASEAFGATATVAGMGLAVIALAFLAYTRVPRLRSVQ